MGDKKLDLQKSVASLNPPDKEGWCTKQGGSWKSWKRRWLVLKDKRLWYLAAKTSVTAKGYIMLEANVKVAQEPGNKKQKFMFSIESRGIKGERKFMIGVDTAQELDDWQKAIKKNLGETPAVTPTPTPASTGTQQPNAASSNTAASSGSTTTTTTTTPKECPTPVTITPTQTQPTTTTTPTNPTPQQPVIPAGGGTVPVQGKTKYAKLEAVKNAVQFLQEPDSKVLEFWQMWIESIPSKEELEGQNIEFHVAASTDLDKLSWRTNGPQSIVIQKMVDFFWNVGAPEPEIDKLNEVGAAINPARIGSWIDMSAKNGMDGGWYFPVDITPKAAIGAADAGEPTRKLLEWCDAHGVTQCYTVGRDMGAAPPRQTEMRLRLPAGDFPTSLALTLDAFNAFGFAPIPENILTTVRANPCESITMSVITSTDGFVRLGIMLNKPSTELVRQLVEATGNKDKVARLGAAAVQPPCIVELQHLRAGFGYSVYKEGFDVVLHWDLSPDL